MAEPAPLPSPLPAPGGLLAPASATVQARRDEGAGVVSLWLVRDGEPAEVPPGTFCMVWAPGVGECALSVSAVDGDALVVTVRPVGAVTEALAAVAPGSVLGVRGPFGRGWDLAGAAGGDLLVVAGGIGLAPLRPVVHHLLAQRDEVDRLVLAVGARSPADLLYVDELREWGGRFDVDVLVTVDRAAPGWQGEVGVVTRLLGSARTRPERTTALVCGPEVMMRFAGRELVDLGVDPRRIQLSLERNMRCGVGLCGHCQLGPLLLCREGPVGTWPAVARLLEERER